MERLALDRVSLLYASLHDAPPLETSPLDAPLPVPDYASRADILGHAERRPLDRRAASPRIAMVSEYYYPHLGGVTEHVHYLSRELRRMGCHVDVVTSTIDASDDRSHVIRVGRSLPVRCNASMARLTMAWRLRDRLRALFREQRYDLVHVHCPLAPTLPLAAVDAAQVPVVGTFHTWFPSSRVYERGRPFFQRRLDKLDVAVAVSPAAAEAHGRYFDAEWEIIPNGIDTHEFRPALPRPACFDADTPTILFVGRFDPRNELGMLIDALPLVQRDIPSARLVIVGDGALRRHYRARAGANPSIHFAESQVAERGAYYSAATVYACPTTRASFGVTLLEAMAAGTPIVCTDLPGFRSVVTPGREAIMHPAHDVNALAQALVLVLRDASLRARLSAHGLRRAHDFRWSVVATQVLGAYARAGCNIDVEQVA
ncbi:MAG: glycosyltransferase family 4 protein [Gemmatimonadaceae bacterium]|nr:glycosyltransferase family 4 protein [Gemmatimonadaceae bacterium]